MELRRVRHKYDFLFWAYFCIQIKFKTGGRDRFKLNYPQLLVLIECEKKRRKGVPIDIIICKARQWGGSTFCIFYQTWLAFEWDEYHSFVIAAQVQGAADTILHMLKNAMRTYPAWDFGLEEDTILKIAKRGETGSAYVIKDEKGNRILETVIYIGSAEKPDSLRSSDVAGAHYSEIGVWPNTPEKRPEDLVADISGGIPKIKNTMQVMESTAKSSDDFFHEMYISALKGESSYTPIFIPWFYIPHDSMPIENKEEFVEWLLSHKDEIHTNGRWKDSGKHYWWLWTLGATLEGLNWYRYKRLDYTNYTQMANEAPSTYQEAFQATGNKVFDPYDVDEMRKLCTDPVFTGELVSDERSGKAAITGVSFRERRGGVLRIWDMPDCSKIKDRYLVVVDVGGHNPTSDYSSVRVIDRKGLMKGEDGVPKVVAEMHYHTDHDLLAYDAMRLAYWYNKALLVIESNTLETKDKERDVGGFGTEYILDIVSDIYPNIYARDKSSEEIDPGKPRKWGFHTNTKTKPKIIDHLKKCVREQLWIEPSALACDEISMYVDIKGKFTAPPKKHDDVLMATAIGLYIAYEEMDRPKWIDSSPIEKEAHDIKSTCKI